ncbi:MAG: hypothetical protein ABIO93_03380 [Dyadobacter sp.]|uniref:hypothetical protein n=1 Tax=Dyadobacter sp. TaxID=1914288 RepID=UPI0032656641
MSQLSFYLRLQAQQLNYYAGKLDHSADFEQANGISFERTKQVPKDDDTNDFSTDVELNDKKYSFSFILTRNPRKQRIWVYAD